MGRGYLVGEELSERGGSYGDQRACRVRGREKTRNRDFVLSRILEPRFWAIFLLDQSCRSITRAFRRAKKKFSLIRSQPLQPILQALRVHRMPRHAFRLIRRSIRREKRDSR